MAAYGATHSLQRVTALQSLCRKPGPSTADDGSPDALLFVAGQDGDQNTGSAALVRYLLHGRSGAELVDSVLSSADEDDAIVVVRAASIGVYCNHAVWKRLQPLTVLWQARAAAKAAALAGGGGAGRGGAGRGGAAAAADADAAAPPPLLLFSCSC